MIANALVDIWRAEGVHPVPKYEDDLSPFRFPTPNGRFTEGEYRYDYDCTEILRRVSPLSVPWHEEKGNRTFTSITTFIGFLWDMERKTVSLPENQHRKFHERVRRFLASFSNQPCMTRDVEKIHGSLCHVAFVHLDGRSHLPSLSNFASSFHDDEFITR
jgi:hypothetical protein